MKPHLSIVGILLNCLFFLACAPTALAAVFSIDEWEQRVSAEDSIDRLGRLYLEFLMEENPVSGVQFGIHGREGDPSWYDRRLPDVSLETAARISSARKHLQDHLDAIDPDTLARPDQIDLHILKNQVALDQLQVTRLDALSSPLNYVTTLGQAMSGLVLRDYAPLEERLQSFGARCAATPAYLEQTRGALLPPYVRPTELDKAQALGRLRAMTQDGSLYTKTLPELLQSSALDDERQAGIREQCGRASEEIERFAAWLEENILPRENGEWRLGRELYDLKYQLQMDYPLGPEELLAEAEKWLEQKGGELVSVGRRIHDEYLADEIRAGILRKQAELDDSQVVRNIFAKLSEDRSTPETLIADSYAMADAIIGFVREQNLMDLPPASKLRIEDIPPHLRGTTVAMIATAPPFEPHLESVWFWDLEFLASSPDFLKEYNRPALAMVYIHEGVPGHFVQLEYSNRFERIIPKVFWNGPMVEGWASYIATQLVDVGFTIYPDHPLGHELQQMVDDKLMLRAIINAIIDLRLHREGLGEEEAVALMTGKGFQEESEARGKLARAKLSSVQLATYFAGHLAIEKILAEYRELRGSAFSWKDFNERLVGAGSPPFFATREYMLQDVSDK
jgi:uncharacterized protein (DUF885 family)